MATKTKKATTSDPLVVKVWYGRPRLSKEIQTYDEAKKEIRESLAKAKADEYVGVDLQHVNDEGSVLQVIHLFGNRDIVRRLADLI